MDFRHWLLTWRTYGTWLPGDERGFVDPIVMSNGERVIHNNPGEPMDADCPALRRYSRGIMAGEPVLLRPQYAVELFSQFRETARYRAWDILAVAILANHVHLVVRVAGDPDGAEILRDFKGYASRRLNLTFGKCPNGSWWSESGSRRILKDDGAIAAAIRYVSQQAGAFLVWVALSHQPADAGRSPPAG